MNALLWDCCFSMHKSLYQQPAVPVGHRKIHFYSSLYLSPQWETLFENELSFPQNWGGFKCCEPPVILFFFLLNLNGMCQATLAQAGHPSLWDDAETWNWTWTFVGGCIGNRRAGCACGHLCILVQWIRRCDEARRLCFAARSIWSFDIAIFIFYFFTFWRFGLGSGRVLHWREVINVLTCKCCSF